VGLLVFADAAQIGSLYPGQSGFGTLFDAGAGIELGSAVIGESRFTFAYGRDVKGKRPLNRGDDQKNIATDFTNFTNPELMPGV